MRDTAPRDVITGMAKARHPDQELARCKAIMELRFGRTVRGVVLARLLGFTSLRSFQRAVTRGEIGVRLYPIPRQVGRCAITAEVAKWLLDAGKDWKALVEDAYEAIKQNRGRTDVMKISRP